MTLDDLEALARAAKDAQAHVACSPDVVLRLIAVARAAAEWRDSLPGWLWDGSPGQNLKDALAALEKP